MLQVTQAVGELGRDWRVESRVARRESDSDPDSLMVFREQMDVFLKSRCPCLGVFQNGRQKDRFGSPLKQEHT